VISVDSDEQRICRPGCRAGIGCGVFFVCFYLYVRLIIEPALIYQAFGTSIDYPAFSLGRSFLNSSLSYPGGPIEYAAGFLSQLLYFSWAGALIITVVASCFWLLANRLCRLAGLTGGSLICYLPAAMLVTAYNRYDHQLTSYAALLVVLLFFVVYERAASRRMALGVATFSVMFVVLYYIAGGASLVFALLAAIYELVVRRRRVLGMSFLAGAGAAYFIGRYFFDLQIEVIPLRFSVFADPDPWVKSSVICLYLFFPLVLVAAGLGQKSADKAASSSRPQRRRETRSSGKGKAARTLRTRQAMIGQFLAGAAIVCVAFSFDGTKKKLMEVDRFAHNRMWTEVLDTASRIPPESYDMYCIHDINRALHSAGSLGDRMFCYPQTLSALMLTNIGRNKPSARMFVKRSRLFLEMGHVADAERDAFEVLELVGDCPSVLELLATIKLVKGQTEAAKVFLRVLAKDLIHGGRGRELLRQLDEDPQMSGNRRIGHLRSVATDKESTRSGFEGDDFFVQLLEKNSSNRMAFEYMMAFYLLTGQTDKITANIGRLRALGYTKLPRHYEEAIVIYMGSGRRQMDLYGWELSAETIERAKSADAIYRSHGGKSNKQRAAEALAANFGDSYIFYYIFDAPKTRR